MLIGVMQCHFGSFKCSLVNMRSISEKTQFLNEWSGNVSEKTKNKSCRRAIHDINLVSSDQGVLAIRAPSSFNSN